MLHFLSIWWAGPLNTTIIQMVNLSPVPAVALTQIYIVLKYVLSMLYQSAGGEYLFPVLVSFWIILLSDGFENPGLKMGLEPMTVPAFQSMMQGQKHVKFRSTKCIDFEFSKFHMKHL